ncbi:MAG: polysaccharide biosynthesis tyrosine autokinase [Ferruginibacter sp.]|nr:polysaccharide biosynthesis tyrosine autokinase [Ferruginibacter sp.]
MKQVKNIENGFEEKESSMMGDMMAKYIPYWPLFILVSALAIGAAYVYLRYATPIYEAKATMIIKDEKRGSEDSKLMESLNLIASKKVVENEIEVLQSRSLMEQVVKKLRLYAPVYEQGKVKASDAYMISPVLVEAQNPDSLDNADKISFVYNNADKTVTLENKDKFPLNEFVNTDYGTLRFVPNKNFSASRATGKPMYFSIENPKIVASQMLGGLKVSSSRQSAIVDLSYRDPVRQRAADILSQLIIAYDQTSKNEINSLARNTLAFINERLAILGKDLDSIEKKVQKYKSGSNAVDISSQGQVYLQNVGSNDQKLSEVNNQLAIINQVEKSVSTADKNSAIVPSTLGVSDPMLSNMLNKLYSTQLEYDKLKKTVGENNPSLLALKDEINKIKPSILQNIQNQKSSLLASRQSISATSGSYNSFLSSIPQKERQLLEISREQQSKNNLYQILLQKKEESELSYASTVSNSRIVDEALAGKDPVSPKRKLIYMMAIMGALGLSVGFIFIKDAFSNKVKYRAEIEKTTSVPVIAEITFDKSKTPLVIEKGRRSVVAEEFRKLRISLSFLGIDPDHKKILVTSSISGEGKSFVAANLAKSLSLTGKKVVLVDVDLNVPTLSKIFNVPQREGVTEFLKGERYSDDIIHPVDGHENLSFISPGEELPDNPSELLANGKIGSLIDYLSSRFDMVIIDTSPAVLVSDAFIVSDLCDATLYVVRHNYTPKLLVKRIEENMEINPLKNLAIIFNGVKTRGFFKNNYGYGYNYVYGSKQYGYTQQNLKQKKSA